MLYDIVFNYMLIYHLVYSILFSFSTECILFGLMLDCIIEETTVIVYFSKTEEHKRQQIATGEENKEGGEGRKKKKKSHIGRAADVCCPGEMNSCAAAGTDFLCPSAHLAKRDFSQRVTSCYVF